MQKNLVADQLAREDRFVRMAAQRSAELREEQGLAPTPRPFEDPEFLKARLHAIFVGEMEAMEGAGRTVYDFDQSQVPWEFTLDMARQVWDESRHVEIFAKLLEHIGCYIGEYVETEILWECACASDPAARVAGINRGLEGLACDVFAQIIQIARKLGDETMAGAVDFVLADEITHVRMGTRWMRKLTEGDPDRREAALAFQHRIDDLFNFQGARQDKQADEAVLIIDRESRKLAGFTDEEIERLIKATTASPMY